MIYLFIWVLLGIMVTDINLTVKEDDFKNICEDHKDTGNGVWAAAYIFIILTWPIGCIHTFFKR